MISVFNFREYLIALGAVFLALALGILIGVSFSDSVLVAGQRDVIELMEGRLAGLEELIRGQVKELRRWETVKPLLRLGFRDALEGKEILLFGDDTGAAEQIRTILEESGAGVKIFLTLSNPAGGEMGPGETVNEVEELTGLLSAPGPITAAKMAELGLQFLKGGRGAADGGAAGAAGVTGAAEAGAKIEAAAEDGEAILQAPPDCCLILPGFSGGFLHELWQGLHQRGMRVIALFPWREEGGPPRPPRLRPEATLVDNIDTFWGQLALRRLLAGEARGHYGFGSGSKGLFPEAAEND